MTGNSLGDLAESAIHRLVAATSAPVEEATALTEEAAFKANSDLFTKIRFTWRTEDRAILDRIRISADVMFQEAFASALAVIDDFYCQLRIPEQHNGLNIIGPDGRFQWKRNDQGHIIESWDQLDGNAVEHTLANLARLKMQVAPQVNQLFLEALYARNVASDIYDDAWFSRLEGTQGDRSAWSNRESRQDRYAAFFRFYLYSVADTFIKEVQAFQKLLENVRYWQVRTQKG